MRFLFILCCLLACAHAADSAPPGRALFADAERRAAGAVPSDTVTFAVALARIADRHPVFAAAAARTDAAARTVGQAGAHANPRLGADAENVGGTYTGFDRAELTFVLLQDIELGGKRGARTELAARLADASVLEADVSVFELYLEARRRYAEAIHTDERLRIARANRDVVAELAEAAGARVRAGAAPTADRLLADVALARAEQEVHVADVERGRARRSLAALWLDGGPPFASPVETSIPLPRALPPVDSLAAWTADAIPVSRARRAAAHRRAALQVEKSLRVPTVTAGGGYRRVEADDADTFVFGVAMPLPLWDRRSEAVRAAEAEVRAGDLDVEAARAAARDQLLGSFDRLAAMLDRLRRWRADTIPSAQAAAREMETVYRMGGASYVDLLEVQRLRIEMENEVNDLRLDILDEVVAIERLTGRTVEEMVEHE